MAKSSKKIPEKEDITLEEFIDNRMVHLVPMIEDHIQLHQAHDFVQKVWHYYDAGEYSNWKTRLDDWLDTYSLYRKNHTKKYSALQHSAEDTCSEIIASYYYNEYYKIE